MLVDGLVIRAGDGLGAVAPEMAGRFVFAFPVGERFLRRGTHVEGFGPEMFAKSRVHDGVNLSI